MFSHQSPYIFIESTNPQKILNKLNSLNVTRAHFTNGTYALSPEFTIATTLAGFKHVLEDNDNTLPLIIAINSDESMRLIGKKGYKDEKSRADIVATPLAKTFPDNKVIVLFYDEATPNQLYAWLSKNQMTHSLFKWGYGTVTNAPKIEGAEFFNDVYAYSSLPNATPICWHDTPHVDQKNIIKVVNLCDKLITPEYKCLFSLPESLKCYQAVQMINIENNINDGSTLKP